jgi:hypothetical protein
MIVWGYAESIIGAPGRTIRVSATAIHYGRSTGRAGSFRESKWGPASRRQRWKQRRIETPKPRITGSFSAWGSLDSLKVAIKSQPKVSRVKLKSKKAGKLIPFSEQL